MALHAAPTPIEAARAVLDGRRGIPDRIVITVADALAPCVEGQALASDVEAGVARITTAATAGSRLAVINEANRLAFRAADYRREFRRIAAAIEDPEGPEAA